MQSDVLERFIDALHEYGADRLPPQHAKEVLDAEWERICDQDTGFAYFWLWYAFIYIKGRGPDTKWQRACPGGVPRENIKTGRTWAWQLAVCLEIVLHDLQFWLKCRQIGWSHIFGNLIVWAAISVREQRVAVVSNRLQSAWNNMRRSKMCYRRLPAWIQARVALENPAVTRMEYSNGSVVEAYSGDPDALRSEGVGWLLVDEIGEVKRLMDFFAAAQWVAEGGGKMVMGGTAKDNGLEQWCIDCDAGDVVGGLEVDGPDGARLTLEVKESDGGMAFSFLPYYLHPARDDEWMEKKRRTYRGNLNDLAREMPSTWQDAFHAVGLGYFDRNALQSSVQRERVLFEARDRRGTVLTTTGDRSDARFVEDRTGQVVFHCSEAEFVEAMASGRPWAAGADSAGEKQSGDYFAASFVHCGRVPRDDAVPGPVIPHRQLITIHGYMDTDLFAELLVRVGLLVGGALINPEANYTGAAVIKAMRRMRYPYLYTRRSSATKKGDERQREYGWLTTQTTKQVAYGETERLFRNGHLEVRDVETLREMNDVMNLGGGRIGAREPKHEDRPDGLTLACVAIPYTPGIDRIAQSLVKPPFYSYDEVWKRADDRAKAAATNGMRGYV